MSSTFDVPVCLFFFLRTDKLFRILDVVREIKPTKVYLLSDGPRNDEEAAVINQVRQAVLNRIDWPCQVVKFFHETNVGVFQNIGMGALDVFKQEKQAIFLEDDNLPSSSFFEYCRQTLQMYENEPRVLWICGTNYLGKTAFSDSDFYFTRHMLPCGWASWAPKFTKYYDGNLTTFSNIEKQKQFKRSYSDRRLYRQQLAKCAKRIQPNKNPVEIRPLGIIKWCSALGQTIY